ncbi:efflux RND transporter periplasmic adaptor subunit [Arsenicibacter rosenii]|uniref:Efflux transporter periplasmic adaptor subunit n=1 Tax=Arsenicibacter rosenii TaxID=1750698 RepID=A0A1S2VH14_9BACT|nr:efflux RND transporter periplasmic adaptor subunit [Arsenicibacter rosenii]OIN57525.1 efflux transporter periplasmic adaptor subunit [Arsenicibacter rosenii]
MRTFVILFLLIGALVLGKIFFFPKPEGKPKDGTGGGGSGKGGDKGKSAEKSPTIPVSIYLAKTEKFDNTLAVSGTVLPNEVVELKAEVSGRLMQLNGKEGTYVNKGELIAKINDDELKAQLVKLGYVEKRARDLEARQKRLLAIDGISREEYDIAESNVNTARADKDLLLTQLAKTEIRAPFSGKLGLRAISQGAYLSPGTLITTLVQTNPVKVDFAVPEKYAGQVRVGSMVRFTTEGVNAPMYARVAAVSPLIDEALRTLKIRAYAANPSGHLVPGMFVRVDLPLQGDNNSIQIPSQAIVPVLKGKKVYVVRNGKAQETFIKTGIRNDQQVQVTDGLTPGDSVITSSIMALKNGTSVKPKIQ